VTPSLEWSAAEEESRMKKMQQDNPQLASCSKMKPE
jgi:hypothetical protein